MSSVVRTAGAGDAEAIAELEKKCFGNPWSLESVRSSLAEGTFALILEDGKTKEAIGYMLSDMRAEDEAELWRIAIVKERRGEGLSKLLMHGLLSEASVKNKTSVFLEVREKNTPAIGLYEKSGFEKLGIRKNYYRDPPDNAVIMRRSL